MQSKIWLIILIYWFSGLFCRAQPQALDSIPNALSNITINTDLRNNEGYLFFAPYFNQGYVVISNSDNEVVFYKEVGGYGARDFKMHSNGMISYFSGESAHFMILNKHLEVVDSVQCKNDLITDFHDFSILPNKNYCLLCRGTAFKDFSPVGGAAEHLAVNPVIQIQDSLHQVIYEWEAATHFDGLHVIYPLNNFNPNGNLKNFIHLNSFDVDVKGNFLISARFQSQVSYVDQLSGEIVWRFGGPQNEFTFTNDVGFSDQHSVRWTGENTILLFDNGCFDEKNYSRAVEYFIDLEEKTATKIWEFVRPDSIHTGTLGSCQRLSNGNTLTSWGDAGMVPLTLLEISTKGEVVFDLKMDSLIYTYSAYAFKWPVVKDTVETAVNINNKSPINIYPNPSSNYFILEFDALLQVSKFELANCLGQVVLAQDISAQKTSVRVIHQLLQGVYFLRMMNKEKPILCKKLIVGA